MSRQPVPGDPASMSRLATSAMGAGRLLRGAVQDLTEAVAADSTDRPRRMARDLARRAELLTTSSTELVDELTAAAALLQDQAIELARVAQAFRQLHERADSAGFRLAGGRWEPTWGITGTADAQRVAEVDAVRSGLQHDLDSLVRTAGRRRAALVAALGASTDRLAVRSAALRHG